MWRSLEKFEGVFKGGDLWGEKIVEKNAKFQNLRGSGEYFVQVAGSGGVL